MTEPDPRFGETFGFALFCQDSVSFARFLTAFAHFLTDFARFRPFFAPFSPFLRENSWFLPGFTRFCPVLPVLPGLFSFVQIHQDSFGFVRPLFAWFRPSLIITEYKKWPQNPKKKKNHKKSFFFLYIRKIKYICPKPFLVRSKKKSRGAILVYKINEMFPSPKLTCQKVSLSVRQSGSLAVLLASSSDISTRNLCTVLSVVQCSAIQYSAVPCTALLYSTVQCRTVHCFTVQ